MTWLIRLWQWQQRRTDLAILWPICKREAAAKGLSIDHAKAAFALHAFNDLPWQALGEDEITRRIDALQ